MDIFCPAIGEKIWLSGQAGDNVQILHRSCVRFSFSTKLIELEFGPRPPFLHQTIQPTGQHR